MMFKTSDFKHIFLLMHLIILTPKGPRGPKWVGLLWSPSFLNEWNLTFQKDAISLQSLDGINF
jgi:hypothetical protein